MLLSHWPVAVDGVVGSQAQGLRPLLRVQTVVQAPDVDVSPDVSGGDPLVVHSHAADEHLVADDSNAGGGAETPEAAGAVPRAGRTKPGGQGDGADFVCVAWNEKNSEMTGWIFPDFVILLY